MPRLTLVGYDKEAIPVLIQEMEAVLKEARLENDGVIQYDYTSSVISGDGKKHSMPYIQLFTTEVETVAPILAALQKVGMRADVEVYGIIAIFLESSDFMEGAWRTKLAERLGKGRHHPECASLKSMYDPHTRGRYNCDCKRKEEE